jgi:hypothetical protein
MRNLVAAVMLVLLVIAMGGGCGGGAITSLGKDEFQTKVKTMTPEEVVKWLGKPTIVTNDSGMCAWWFYENACCDKLTGAKCNAKMFVVYKPELHRPGSLKVGVYDCDFSSGPPPKAQ